MSDVSVSKDNKGLCYFLSHKRCGMTEGVFLTLDELKELKEILNKII
jgi:hypothetical protein